MGGKGDRTTWLRGHFAPVSVETQRDTVCDKGNLLPLTNRERFSLADEHFAAIFLPDFDAGKTFVPPQSPGELPRLRPIGISGNGGLARSALRVDTEYATQLSLFDN